jgi:anti-sigma-K factor RskA
VGVSEHRDEHLDLCAGFALGALGDADRARLEAHLAEGCPVCEAALADFSQGAVGLARSVQGATASPELRRRVLEAASASRPGRVIELKPRASRFAWEWAAAAAFLAITTAVMWNEGQSLRSELSDQQKSLSLAQRKIAEDQSLIGVLSARGARVAEMQITPAGVKELRARATYDPNSKSAVIVLENFAPPSGHDYTLWALRSTGVANLGVIHTDAAGRAVLKLENLGDPDTLGGFAISLEPAGGSPFPDKPTGPVVMAGKFAG